MCSTHCKAFRLTLSNCSDFLKSLDEPSFFAAGTGIEGNGISPGLGLASLPEASDPVFNTATNNTASSEARPSSSSNSIGEQQQTQRPENTQHQKQQQDAPPPTESNEVHLNLRPSNQNDRYLLAAADQKEGSRDERLARVIHAKFEAGLLKPYDYVAGYRRLFRWMESNMSATSRKRTLQTISEFRPAFRVSFLVCRGEKLGLTRGNLQAIASSLTDLDLILIEEAFERLLLDYDRVFSTMGIPACLWRRTGEIYKGNKEFADLIGVSIDSLRDGRLAIYEVCCPCLIDREMPADILLQLMAEESAANYWEKYGSIAFNSGQKAVLTSCVLVHQTRLSNWRSQTKARNNTQQDSQTVTPREVGMNCTFSFTVRRDSANSASFHVFVK